MKCAYGWVPWGQTGSLALIEWKPHQRLHDSQAVDRLLAGYKGYLVADAHVVYVVYDHLFADGEITEVGCWAHARRYFFKALGTEPELAKVALGMIRKLFKIEEKLAKATRRKRESVRRKLSAPVVDVFSDWCAKQDEVALDGSPIAAALTYVLNLEDALRRLALSAEPAHRIGSMAQRLIPSNKQLS